MTMQLDQLYKTKVVPELREEFAFSTVMRVPRLEKIVVSSCVGDVIQNKKRIESVQQEISLIAGQRAMLTKAKKSVANFKLREGMYIGVKVTLRGRKMYDFLYRLVHVALPRVRDFRGIKKNSFDGNGMYSLGIQEHIIFPEIDYDKIDKVIGLNITFCTTAKNDEEAFALLKRLQLPFVK